VKLNSIATILLALVLCTPVLAQEHGEKMHRMIYISANGSNHR